MKTLEHLLLETLAEERMTTKGLCMLWGADRVTVSDWLSKFCKRRLCSIDGDGMYKGDPDKISAYLLTTK